MLENRLEHPQILCITNDFGPRAGGIETFIIGLIQRLPKNCVIVYTALMRCGYVIMALR